MRAPCISSWAGVQRAPSDTTVRIVGEATRRPPLARGKRVLLVTGGRSDVGPLVAQLQRWEMEHQACVGASEAARTPSGSSFDKPSRLFPRLP